MSITTLSADGTGDAARPARSFPALVVGSIGVVYGDIGTSPLYALREALARAAGGGIAPGEVVGVVSLLLYTLTLVVSFKYIVLMLKADNNGEGGVLSLLALAERHSGRSAALLCVGIVAAALFYGDALVTPAISVLSAVEGLKHISPSLEPAALPLALAILTALFMSQAFGTARIARLFGPLMIVWFIVIAGLGAVHVGDEPAILAALDPRAAISFMRDNGVLALAVLGTVFLAVTGAEALYADLGHFGAGPIRVAWSALVFPALALNYLGQGAMILSEPAAADDPFFLLAPSWAILPLVVLATLATVIAAQAVITGAFSLTHQAIQLGLLPRMEVRHTSAEHAGQIYLPKVALLLYVGVVALVLAFGGSAELAGAYGIAVAGNMAATSILAIVVLRRAWGWSPLRVAAVMAPIMLMETMFLGANFAKIASGGFVPIGLAVLLVLVMATFVRGTRLVAAKAAREAIPMEMLARRLSQTPPATARGTAVFMTADPSMAPSSLLHNLKHNGVLHEHNLILSVRTAGRPRVPDGERVAIEALDGRFKRITLTFGYMEVPNVTAALTLARRAGLKFEIMSTSFFLSRRALHVSHDRGPQGWLDRFYVRLNAQVFDAVRFYRLPANRVIELGQQLAI